MPKRQEFQIVGGPEFRRVELALEEVDKALPSKFRRALADAAKPMANDAKRRVLGIRPTQHAGHTGLRAKVAKGVRVRAGHVTGQYGFVRISTSMPQPDEAVIPRGLDRREGWRHPVYGNRNYWVSQHTGGHGWFTNAMKDGEKPTERRLNDVLQWAAERIDSAGD